MAMAVGLAGCGGGGKELPPSIDAGTSPTVDAAVDASDAPPSPADAGAVVVRVPTYVPDEPFQILVRHSAVMPPPVTRKPCGFTVHPRESGPDQTYVIEYDAHGYPKLERATAPEGLRTTYEYDASGHLRRLRTDQLGLPGYQWDAVLDDQGRLDRIDVSYADGPIYESRQTLAFDAKGRRARVHFTSMERFRWTLDYSYDDLGRIVEEDYHEDDVEAVTWTIRCVYDDVELTRICTGDDSDRGDPYALVWRSTFLPDGRLEKYVYGGLSGPATRTVTLTYDEAGLLVSEDDQGTVTTFQNDCAP